MIRTLAVAVATVLVAGCASLWSGDFERDGYRHIYLYEVQEGDTIYRIAWRHGLPPSALIEWNEIDNPEDLRVGRMLVLNPPSGGVTDPGAEREDTAADREVAAAPPPSPSDPPDYELDWLWPVDGPIVREYATDQGGKTGVELGGSEGDTVRAAAEGQVAYSGSGLRGYGNLVILMHDDRFLTAYGYNRRLLVDEGESVEQGQPIAEMGKATGADHASLHFELRIDGDPTNPADYLPSRQGGTELPQ